MEKQTVRIVIRELAAGVKTQVGLDSRFSKLGGWKGIFKQLREGFQEFDDKTLFEHISYEWWTIKSNLKTDVDEYAH